jgi:hypothetical protein
MRVFLLFLISISFFTSTTCAQTWDGGGDGVNWSDPLNWNTKTVPTSSGAVSIGNFNVSLNVTTTCASLTFTGNSGSLTVGSGHTLTVTGNIVRNGLPLASSSSLLAGLGKLIVNGNVNVGSSISPSNAVSNILETTIDSLIILGNINLIGRITGTNIVNNPRIYFKSGVIKLSGQIVPNLFSNTNQGARVWMDQNPQTATLILTNTEPWAPCGNCAIWDNGNAFYDVKLDGINSKVIYAGEVNQKINQSGYDKISGADDIVAINYNNLTLSGSGVKTLPIRSSMLIKGTLSMQGSATFASNGTLAYYDTVTSTLEYKGSVPQLTGVEFLDGLFAPRNLTIDNSFGVTLQAPRTLRTGRSNTLRLLSGTLTNTNNITLNTGSTIIRSGGAIASAPVFGTSANLSYNQHTASVTCGPELPTSTTTINNLTINNLNGVIFDRNVTVNGSLTMTNGILSIEPSDTLEIFSGNQIAGTFGSQTHIYTKTNITTGAMGYVRSKVSGVRSFPLGDGLNYLPATLSLTDFGTNEFNLAVFRPATKNGQSNGTVFTDLSPLVNAIWLINRSGAGSIETDITLSWSNPAVLEGTTFAAAANTDIGISRFNGTSWDPITGSGDNTANTATRTGINSFSPFIVALKSATLPLQFGSISAARKNQIVNVQWEAFSEDNVARYEVEKSYTGRSFSKAGLVNAVAQNLSSYKYTWVDATPGNGTVFYRIKAVDNDGKFQYSSIVKIAPENGNRGLNIYPNPMQINGRFNIEAGSLPPGTYNVELIDMSGVRSFNRVLEHAGGSLIQNLELSQSLRPGTYVMKFSGENMSYTATVIIK